jgi:hypothetical protein
MANIMRDAINSSRIPEADRPRIVGLTASFVNGRIENLISKRHDLEALLLARMWAPSLDVAEKRSLKWQQVDGWAYPQDGEGLEQWAKERVEALLLPLSNALAPIKTSTRVANDAAHVLVQLGMRACVFYLEYGIFPELETKASDLLKGRESVRQASDALA